MSVRVSCVTVSVTVMRVKGAVLVTSYVTGGVLTLLWGSFE
jgi:hypothetical protein